MNDQIRDTQTITVIGAGLAGALCAIYLARAGFQVEVFERGGDPREAGAAAGRSINLALAERGIAALRQVGLHHRVAQIALPMRGRMIHDATGATSLQPYGQDAQEVIYSVHRAELNRTLLDAAQRTKRVRMFFNQELIGINFASNQAEFLDHASKRPYQRQVFPLIAADGAGSKIRDAIEQTTTQPSDADLLLHGYRELTIPTVSEDAPVLVNDALHIWPRSSYMMIALPNSDGTFTATLFMGRQGKPSFEQLAAVDNARSFFAEKFPDALPVLSQFDDDWRDNPIGILGTIRCPQWHIEGKAMLLGDAAHAIVPFHGQGMNAAFEDCPSLLQCIARNQHWSQAFADFQTERQDNTNAIADMALENYVEMRDSVVDPGYLLRRLLERRLEQRHPNHFVPRYSMVMFRTLPYAEAQRRGRINLSILRRLTESVTDIDLVDYQLAASLIERKLEPLHHEEEE